MDGHSTKGVIASGVITAYEDALAAWNALNARLPAEQQDPCAHPAYVWANRWIEGGEPVVMTVDGPDGVLWWPMMVRPLPASLGVEGADATSVYGFGGPVGEGDWPSLILQWQTVWEDYCHKRQIVCEFHRFHPLLKNHHPAHTLGGWWQELVQVKDIVWVDLTQSEEALWNAMSSQRRRYLRRGEKNGLEFVSSPSLLEDFRVLYEQAMGEKQTTDFYFFNAALYKDLKAMADEGSLWVCGVRASSDASWLSLALFTVSGHTIHYFLGANHPEARPHHSSEFLLWKAGKMAQEKGLSWYTLGGGMGASDSLFHFKQQFSNTTAPFVIGTRIHDAKSYEQLKTAYAEAFLAGDEGAVSRNTVFFYRSQPSGNLVI